MKTAVIGDIHGNLEALEPCRVAYDVAAAARKIEAAGLPSLLARRLFLGR